MTKKNDLDIWETLRHVDDTDRGFISSLDEESKRGFVPVVTMRWLSGTANEAQLISINNIVNPLVFSLYKYPELLYSLMVCATPTGRKEYFWVKKAKKSKRTKALDVISRYLEVCTREAKMYAARYTPADIIEMAEELGESPDFVKGLKAELK